MEIVGAQGDFIQVRVPDKNTTGYLPKDHTQPWEPPQAKEISPIIIGIVAVCVLGALGMLLFFLKDKEVKRTGKGRRFHYRFHQTGRRAFRMSDYEGGHQGIQQLPHPPRQ